MYYYIKSNEIYWRKSIIIRSNPLNIVITHMFKNSISFDCYSYQLLIFKLIEKDINY
jgi:hypothetical protein